MAYRMKRLKAMAKSKKTPASLKSWAKKEIKKRK